MPYICIDDGLLGNRGGNSNRTSPLNVVGKNEIV